MTETTDELLLVERVGGLLHSAYRRHLLVHRQQRVLRHLDLQAGRLSEVAPERVFVQLDGERLRVGSVLCEGRRIGRCLECTDSERLEHHEKKEVGCVSLVGKTARVGVG